MDDKEFGSKDDFNQSPKEDDINEKLEGPFKALPHEVEKPPVIAKQVHMHEHKHEKKKIHHDGSANLDWYNKWYKLMLAIPLLIFVISAISLGLFYQEHGDIMNRDVSLAGGTTVTIQGEVDSNFLEGALESEFSDVSVREIKEVRTGKKIATIVESGADPDTLIPAIEDIVGFDINNENSGVEFTGPTLGSSFYKQLGTALVFAFIFISIVIFFLFRTVIPSLAVIFAILGDMVITLAIVNFFGISLSAAGIAAFLMLIGFSVDTDILLTSRVLRRREGSVNERIYGAFKTGFFMTFVGLLAVIPAFFIVTGLPDSFRQIFLIVGIGLGVDIMNTWLTNASILKWYTEVKDIR